MAHSLKIVPAGENDIFVFGSNLSGIHGAGAARYAYEHRGAIWNQGIGRFGRSYAIPTKSHGIKYTLPLNQIELYVNGFIMSAEATPNDRYQVTAIGCGLAGLDHRQIAPLFRGAPSNCSFDTLWAPFLPEGASFWGTF